MPLTGAIHFSETSISATFSILLVTIGQLKGFLSPTMWPCCTTCTQNTHDWNGWWLDCLTTFALSLTVNAFTPVLICPFSISRWIYRATDNMLIPDVNGLKKPSFTTRKLAGETKLVYILSNESQIKWNRDYVGGVGFVGDGYRLQSFQAFLYSFLFTTVHKRFISQLFVLVCSLPVCCGPSLMTKKSMILEVKSRAMCVLLWITVIQCLSP